MAPIPKHIHRNTVHVIVLSDIVKHSQNNMLQLTSITVNLNVSYIRMTDLYRYLWETGANIEAGTME